MHKYGRLCEMSEVIVLQIFVFFFGKFSVCFGFTKPEIELNIIQ